jgi:hypothetical protein
MSTLKLNGATNGSSILKAPDTGSTGQIFTLPASTGTLATTADTTDLDGAVVINESGADVDFRVESDGEANMLVVDGGNNAVGIGSATPDSGRKLHIEGGGTGIGITFKDTAGSQWGFINDANLFKLRRDSSAADHIIVNANGIVTKPLNPYFLAEMVPLSGVSAGWTTTSAGNPLHYNTVIHNVGNHYNGALNNYRFTAPVAGVYGFTAGYISTGAFTGRMQFYYNGSQNHTLNSGASNESNHKHGISSHVTTIHAYVLMAVNDYIDVRSSSGDIVHYNNSHAHFGGVLIG